MIQSALIRPAHMQDACRQICDASASGRGHWKLANATQAAGSVTARLSPGWLSLRASLKKHARRPLANPRQWPSLLARHALIGPLVRIGLDAAGRGTLLADLPLDEEEAEPDFAHRLQGLVTAFDGAVKSIATLREGDRGSAELVTEDQGGADSSSSSDAAGINLDDLARRCTEAGWPHDLRSDSVAIGLDYDEAYCPALLAVRPDSGCELVFELPLEAGHSLESRVATASILLRLNREVRYVRAAARGADIVCLEAAWPGLPSSGELGHALSAMSVACRMIHGEAQALQEADVARSYLKLQGWSL